MPASFITRPTAFAKNNDLDYNIYNLFAQAALTPELNVQAEVRRLTSENGDLAFNFDPDAVGGNFQQRVNQNTARAGVRFSPSPRSNILGSAIYNDRDADTLFPAELRAQGEGIQGAGEYLYDGLSFDVATGFSIFDVQTDRRASRDLALIATKWTLFCTDIGQLSDESRDGLCLFKH